jgi:mannose-1-phosphate guanylyltransferase
MIKTRLEGIWVLVLTGVEGERMQIATADLAMASERTPLECAIGRARRIVSSDRICVAVASEHKHFWPVALASVPPQNIVEQPSSRGTFNEILLAVLSILGRDPLAYILVLPAEHYVRDESTLAASLLRAATPSRAALQQMTLVGIRPEVPDPEFDYIIPGRRLADDTRSVYRVVDKSEAAMASELVGCGALWDSYIFAAWAVTLVAMLRESEPELVEQMETALARDNRIDTRSCTLQELYSRLPSVDFSRSVVQRANSKLRVITSLACGWRSHGPGS